MTTEISAQTFALGLPVDETKEEDSKLSSLIERGEKALNELLDGIDTTLGDLRSRFPDVLQSKASLLQMIGAVEKAISDKGFDNLVDSERNVGKQETESKLSGKDRKAMREMFRRIANLTHEDKLRSKGVSDEEIVFMRSVFDEAKNMLDAEDKFGLAYIYTSLLSKSNHKLTPEAIIEAKKAKLKSLQVQRANIEKSFECKIHRIFTQDPNRAEVLYLGHAKKELEMLNMRLQRLNLLNKAEFVNEKGKENDKS